MPQEGSIFVRLGVPLTQENDAIRHFAGLGFNIERTADPVDGPLWDGSPFAWVRLEVSRELTRCTDDEIDRVWHDLGAAVKACSIPIRHDSGGATFAG